MEREVERELPAPKPEAKPLAPPKPKPAAPRRPLERSIWTPRSTWADSRALLDTDEVERAMFDLDWRRCLANGVAKHICRMDDDGGPPDESAPEVAASPRACRKAFVLSASRPATTLPTRMSIRVFSDNSTHLMIFVR